MHLLEFFKQLQQKFQEIYIYFHMMCMHVCLCVDVWRRTCTSAGAHRGQSRVLRALGARVTGACEVSSVRAGN